MKHVKLFEDFNEMKNKTVYQLKNSLKYRKIKDLPPFGYCKVDHEESLCIQTELLDKGYNNFPDFISPQKYYHNIIDPENKNLVVWNGKRKQIAVENTFKDIEKYDVVNSRVFYGYDGSDSPPPFKLIKFEDYFEPKPEYTGHFTGKNYGI